MRNILFCGYRDWSKKIYKSLGNEYKSVVNLIYVTEGDNLSEFVDRYNPDMIFFVGWSWIINKDIIDNNRCICLHPSPLPKYRGGSPLQHQIINGETESAVTLFEMDNGIDTGDILYQSKFSLEGNLEVIFKRIVNWGIFGISKIIDNSYTKVKQDENDATFYKRRKPSMSEISIDDFEKLTAKEIHNKIRSLQDPYPNAYVVCKDGTKLFLKESKI